MKFVVVRRIQARSLSRLVGDGSEGEGGCTAVTGRERFRKKMPSIAAVLSPSSVNVLILSFLL